MSRDRPIDLLKVGRDNLAVVSLMVVLAVVLARNAWLGDDAYISFRTVDNLVNGYGLTWNVDERVQGFTHPLWVLLLSAISFFTGGLFLSSLVVSMLLTLAAAFVVAVGAAGNKSSSVAALAVLILSKAFIDYSSSGLENPLSYFLAAVFLWGYLNWPNSKTTILRLSLLASLAALTRVDSLLIYAPPLLHSVWRFRRLSGTLNLLLGFCPFWLWELFSLWYYGFPFPNTAYAKLGAGIAREDLIHQGLRYLWNGLKISPITVFIIAVGVIVGLVSRRKNMLPPAAGILGYLAYVVCVGGCFMSGRFLALPFLVSVLLLSRFEIKGVRSFPAAVLAGALLLGLYWPRCPLWSGASYGAGPETLDWDAAITDERALNFQDNGLIMVDLNGDLPGHHWADSGRAVAEAGRRAVVRAGVGFYGFAAGPSVHVVDRHGLADPLLARLPTVNAKRWRVGHYNRMTPPGYLEGLEKGVNGINHPDLAVYYDHLRTIIAGDLFSWERLGEIAKFNLGSYDYLRTSYARDSWRTVPHPRVTVPVEAGTAWNAKQCQVLDDMGISVRLNGRCHLSLLEISVDWNDHYRIQFYLQNTWLGMSHIEPSANHRAGLRMDTVAVSASAVRHGYDRVVIQPFGGDGFYGFGHLRLLSAESRSEPGMIVSCNQVDARRPEGTFWRCDECILLTTSGVAVVLDAVSSARAIELSVDGNDRYRVTFLLGGQESSSVTIGDDPTTVGGLRVCKVPVAEATRAVGFDEIHVRPVEGDGAYSMGHLILVEDSGP